MNNTNLGKLSDRDLAAALKVFNSGSSITPTDYALTKEQTLALKAEIDSFEAELDAHDAAQTVEMTTFNAKRQRRKNSLIPMARQQMRLARAAEGVDGKKLAAVGLDLYDTQPTASPAPKTVPMAHIDYGKLKHTIFFRDSAMPDSEAKPDGVRGCEIWRFIGADAPVSEKDYDFVTLDSASPYVAFYDGADAGKNVFYFLRWVSKGDEKGGWGATINATING